MREVDSEGDVGRGDPGRPVEETDEDCNPILYHIEHAPDVTGGIREHLDAHDYHLVIIGASREWAVRRALFGTVPDVIAAAHAHCSVLMVRRYLPEHWSVRASEGLKRFKEAAGFTTFPEGPDTSRAPADRGTPGTL